MGKWMIGKYIRLSQADKDVDTKGDKSESNSISHQRDMIESYIESHQDLAGCEQMEFFDDGYSGKNFERPGFEKLLDKIRHREVNCVIVKDFSRFGRDYLELGDYLERIFPILGVRFISINDHYDSLNFKGTTGGLDVAMKNIVYDYYSKDLSVKVKTAKFQRMKQGELSNGIVPYGYFKDPKDKHRMIVDEEAAEVIRLIYDTYLSGKQIHEIAVMLNERNVDTPAQHYRKLNPKHIRYTDISIMSCWSEDMIKRILRRKTYYGAVVSHVVERKQCGKKDLRHIPEEEQIVVEGMHEPIISKEIFMKVQSLLPKGKPRSKYVGDYPLVKKVRCASCGRACRADIRSPRKNPRRVFFCYYSRTQVGKNHCSLDEVDESRIHTAIWEQLQRLIKLTDTAKNKITKNLTQANHDSKALEKKLASLQKKKDKYDDEYMQLTEQYMMKKMTKTEYQERRIEHTDRIDKLEQEIAEVNDELNDLKEWKDKVLVKDLATIKMCSGAKEFTREISDVTIDKVYIHDQNHIEICWKFSSQFLDMITNSETK